jgi:hypothetical protein
MPPRQPIAVILKDGIGFLGAFGALGGLSHGPSTVAQAGITDGHAAGAPRLGTDGDAHRRASLDGDMHDRFAVVRPQNKVHAVLPVAQLRVHASIHQPKFLP